MATALSTMVTNVGIKLGDSTLQYFTTAEVKKNIGDSYRYYTAKLVTLGEGYFERTTNLDFTANVETIPLVNVAPFITYPFWHVSQIWRYVTNGIVPLRPNEERFDPIYTIGIGTGDAYQPDYRIRGTNIVLIPPPIVTEIAGLKMDFVYQPTFPTSASADAFTFDDNFPSVYEVNVEIRAAIKCMETKDSQGGLSDMSTFRAELAELDKVFEDSSELEEFPDQVAYIGLNYNNL